MDSILASHPATQGSKLGRDIFLITGEFVDSIEIEPI